jgi:putative ABC transport system substrate-binding protein
MNNLIILFTLVQSTLAAGLVAWSNEVWAEQSPARVYRIGFVGITSPANPETGFMLFRDALARLGYVEGKDVTLEARWAEGNTGRLAALMAEVVTRKVDVIVTSGTPGALAARNATTTIPIVAMHMADPARTGLVSNLARPEGNLTGMSMGYGEEFMGKWLEYLRETIPGLSTIALLSNPDNAVFRPLKQDLLALAPKLRLKVQMLDFRTGEEIAEAFKQARSSAQAALLLGDPLTLAQKGRLAQLAIQHRMPVMYNHRIFVDAGGLMSYGARTEGQPRRAAEYVDRILKGAKPAELPIEYPTEFQMVVNLRAAKAIGLAIPTTIISRADEVLR